MKISRRSRKTSMIKMNFSKSSKKARGYVQYRMLLSMSMNRMNGIRLDETKEEQRKRVRKIKLRRSKRGESVVITVDRKNKILIKRFSQIVSSKIYVALRWPCVVRE